MYFNWEEPPSGSVNEPLLLSIKNMKEFICIISGIYTVFVNIQRDWTK